MTVLGQPHHDPSELYVSDPHPHRGDTVELRVRTIGITQHRAHPRRLTAIGTNQTGFLETHPFALCFAKNGIGSVGKLEAGIAQIRFLEASPHQRHVLPGNTGQQRAIKLGIDKARSIQRKAGKVGLLQLATEKQGQGQIATGKTLAAQV